MKNVIQVILLALLLVGYSAATTKSYAQNHTQTNKEFYVRGHVIDADSNEHIPYASVVVKGTTISAITDITGHFSLGNLPIGEHTIAVSIIGYSTEEKTVKVTSDATMINLTFNLKEDLMMLDAVVVSANRTEVTRRESPTIVSVMPSRLFSEVGAPTLADGLSYQPGVRVEDNCQNCGFTQVRINGLDGHYSQILIDSRPMFSALTGVYGLEQIPANMIDRVEVVRGGGSALFGSSAVGGTINIITKTPEYNSAEIAHNLSVIGVGTGQKAATDNNTTANMTFLSDNQKVGATIFGQIRERSAYDANGDGYTEMPELTSSTLGIRTFFKTSDYSKLSVHYDGSSEYRRGGNDLEKVAHEAEVAEQIEHRINGGGVNFDLFSKDYASKLNFFASAQSTNRKSFYGTYETPEAYGTTDELIVVGGAQFSHKWDELWFMPAEFVGGVEYNYNDLEDAAVAYDYSMRQQVNTFSAYAQNEWRNEKFGFLLGLRADKNSLLDNVVFSPRVNFRYNPSEHFNFRATYSTGFRAPQVFDEDLHIAVVGGERLVTRLADDLKQEDSQSFSLSSDMYFNFGRVATNFLVEGFYTSIDDVYVLRQIGEVDGQMVQERYNGSGATVAGVTAEARVTVPNVVEFQGGLTYQQSRYAEAEQWSEDESVEATDEMFRTPDLYGYLIATFPVTSKLRLSLSGTYTGSMLVQHFAGSGVDEDVAVKTPSFFDANFRATYTFPILSAMNMELSAGVQNIFNAYQSDFDSGFERDPGYVYGPMLPRSVSFGVKLLF